MKTTYADTTSAAKAPRKLSPKQKALRFWREWVKPLAIVIIVCTSFRSAVADWNDVPTGSMKPTILEGDRILVNRLAYDLKVPYTTWHLLEWSNPKAGEIVVCYSPANGDRLVKRVVGVPGDRIEMRNNTLSINGRVLSYERLDGDLVDQLDPSQRRNHRFASETLGDHTHVTMTTRSVRRRTLRSFAPIVVPEDEYFVMGDNRDNSADSRVFGFVKRDQILGRTSRVALSLNPDRWYWPRWGRTLHPLE
ncbi:MAG: signal peptidase I [Planctomycetes bacterium]|nr:signal peptidase I [Planctomycetota bacterium]